MEQSNEALLVALLYHYRVDTPNIAAISQQIAIPLHTFGWYHEANTTEAL
jgi:hypothetical protein